MDVAEGFPEATVSRMLEDDTESGIYRGTAELAQLLQKMEGDAGPRRSAAAPRGGDRHPDPAEAVRADAIGTDAAGGPWETHGGAAPRVLLWEFNGGRLGAARNRERGSPEVSLRNGRVGLRLRRILPVPCQPSSNTAPTYHKDCPTTVPAQCRWTVTSGARRSRRAPRGVRSCVARAAEQARRAELGCESRPSNTAVKTAPSRSGPPARCGDQKCQCSGARPVPGEHQYGASGVSVQLSAQ